MDKSTCCLHGCEKKVDSKFLCSMHYARLCRTGTTNARPKSSRVCRMPGCSNKHFRRGWCGMHSQRIDANGSPFDKDQNWIKEEFESCIICSMPITPGNGFRRYCGYGCAIFASKGRLATEVPCCICGEMINLLEVGHGGQRTRSDTKKCRECRGSVNLRSFVPKLAKFKGTDCGICSKPIDMTLKYPDPMSRSVDHILPRSLGGGETIENLSLAHLLCNVRKQNRLDYVAS